MSDLSLSYRKVRYDLRPSKQVERLMLIDALHRLSSDGFPIARYQYTGMGSIHFYDFSLLHRYTGITNMVSVEASHEIKKRVKFNCPYKLIKIRMEKIGAVIPDLPIHTDHLLWLDYDSVMKPSYLADASQAIAHLRPGSIVLLTVDAETPKGCRTPAQCRDYFEELFEGLLPADVGLSDFTPRSLPQLNANLAWRAMQRGLAGRDGVEFQLLFNFVYQDGHRMLTIGGMLTDDRVRRQLRGSSIFDAKYVRRRIAQRPYRIVVPVLTRKERLFLDSAMPCKRNWVPTQFEIKKSDLNTYKDIYRFAPQFAELIL